ncbi:MAG TPA: XdhC family protein [Acidimicrobiia bacterium]|nr:XdhC family protein [Acidimicrobiia bacterium]
MDLLARIARLRDDGVPFALATVTWRQGPSSGKGGAKAIVYADGTVEGWIGGACSRPTVVQQALGALTDGLPRLLALGAADMRPDVVTVPMACASEGAMEVYVEPFLPAPDIHIVGSSPMTHLLAQLAGALGWRVSQTDEPVFGAVSEASMLVVGTQGHYDEPAVEAALATPARYVGLVASEKRAASVRAWLQERGVSAEAMARLRSPAGMDLGPVSHEEIAVAILAELVALRAAGGFTETVTVEEPETAIDPVCEMTVDIATAQFKTEHEGKTYYFCAAGCQRAFEANPEAFL